MGPRGQIILTLLVLVFVTYICEAALLRKSSAVDFLRSGRERRAVRCEHGGCSSEDSEAEELLEANSDYRPNGEPQGEGSGMSPCGSWLQSCESSHSGKDKESLEETQGLHSTASLDTSTGVTFLQQKRSSKISTFLKEAADRDVGKTGCPSQCYYSLDPASLVVTSDDANTHEDSDDGS